MIYYLFIFVAKIIEVSLTTVRTVLITRGEKIYGSLIGFVEVGIWLYVTSSVLSGIKEDPVRMIVYALGFTVGNYVGCIMEEKLAIGLLTINIIASEKDGKRLAKILRDNNAGVTILKGEGRQDYKEILIVHIKRKKKQQVIKLIEDSNIKCMISINDIKTVYGGYGFKK